MTTHGLAPYGRLAVQITISLRSGPPIRGGFSLCTGLAVRDERIEAVGAEGDRRSQHPAAGPAEQPRTRVSLRHGLIDAAGFERWLSQARRGDEPADARALIQLLAENNSGVIACWQLTGVRASSWSGSSRDWDDSGVQALEELVLIGDALQAADTGDLGTGAAPATS